MVQICIRMAFEWFEFAIECFESLLIGSNWDASASNPSFGFGFANFSNPFQMVRICIQMLVIPFELFEYAFYCFESLSNGSNLHSNASNPFEWLSSGGAPTPAGTSVFTKHNWDMGMGYLWLNGWGIYGLLGWTFDLMEGHLYHLMGGAFVT